MAVLTIRLYPDPVLRVRCQEVEQFDDQLHALARDMAETMYDAPGVGLAAPQVGIEQRLAVVDPTAGEEEGHLVVLVNPEIVERTGSETDTEGCLSIPGITDKVTRAASIRVRAQNLEGEPFELEADGLLGRAICHEIDHLDGVLFVDHLRGLRRQRARRHLSRLKADTRVTA